MENKKFIESFEVEDYEVFTDHGWKNISQTHKTIPFQIFEISTESYKLKCADKHKVFDNVYNEIFVEDLLEDDFIQTDKGLEQIKEIKIHNEFDNMYDITVDSYEHRYFTNGILSHNSTVSTVYLLHYAIFHSHKTIAILGNREKIAKEILRRIKMAYSNLPLWLQQGIVDGGWNKHSIELENGSRMLAESTAGSAARGETINCIIGSSKITVKDKKTGIVKDITIDKLFKQLNLKNKFVENNKYEVLTDEGFKDFEGVSINSAKTIKIQTINATISCTPEHKIYYSKTECKKAEDFYVDEYVKTKTGFDKILQIEETNKKEKVYDLVNVDDVNRFFANNLQISNCLFLDEFAFVPDTIADEFMESVYPTISSGLSSKIIIVSTPYGLNHFHKLWQDAIREKNNFMPIKVHWDDVPGRDEEWKENVIKDIGLVKWASQYGGKFLGSTSTLIDPEVLSRINSKRPIELKLGSLLQVWEKPIPYAMYILGVDTAMGVGKDSSVIQVIKINSEFDIEQVAEYAYDKINTYDFSQICIETSKYYNNAYMIVENNAEGSAVCQTIWYDFEYGYIVNTEKQGIGTRSTSKSKLTACLLLKRYMENSWLTINGQELLNELTRYEESSPNRFNAQAGKHDDRVTSLMWALFFFSTPYFDQKDCDIKIIDEKFKIEDDDPSGICIVDDGLSEEDYY